jgi:hypothetical protein
LTKPNKKILRILVKLALAAAVGIVLILFVIAKVGGNSEPLREGVEEFLSQISGTRVVVGTLNYMGFVPDVRVDVKDVTFQELGDPTHVIATTESIRFSKPFIDHLLSKDTFEAFSIVGVHAEAGFITPETLNIDYFQVEDSGDVGARLVGQGDIGDTPVSLTVDIDKMPHRDIRTIYKIKEISRPIFTMGDFTLTGNFTALNPGTQMNKVSLSLGGEEIGHGQGTFRAKNNKPNFEGTAYIGKSDFSIAIKTNEYGTMHISVQSEDFYQEDLERLQALQKKLHLLPLDYLWKQYVVDGAIEITQYHWENSVFEDMKGRIIQSDQQVEIGLVCDETLTEQGPCATYLLEKNNNETSVK